MAVRQLTLPHVDAYLTGDQVAQLLGVHPVTVRRWRTKNKELGYIAFGPPYEVHARRVSYPIKAFHEWCAHVRVEAGVPKINAPNKVVNDVELEIQQALGG